MKSFLGENTRVTIVSMYENVITRFIILFINHKIPTGFLRKRKKRRGTPLIVSKKGGRPDV